MCSMWSAIESTEYILSKVIADFAYIDLLCIGPFSQIKF